jgi:hypothetical protein
LILVFKILDYITLFTLVLLRPLGGVIFLWLIFLTLFTLCPFVTKKGSNFYFWTGNVFSNRSSDFLSQNGQRGSLLVKNDWPYCVGQNHLYVKMFFNRDSLFRVLQENYLSAVRMPNCPSSIRPNYVTYRPDDLQS